LVLRSSIPWSRLLAEFIVIVAGVTTALFADEWRAGRIDRELEQELLVRLVEDVQTDLETADQVIESARQVVVVTSSLLDLLGDSLRNHYEPTPVLSRVLDHAGLQDSSAAGAYRRAVVSLASFGARRETFDEMLTTGSFRVLGNPALRGALSRYYRGIEGREDRLVEITPHPIWTALDGVGVDVRELHLLASPLEVIRSVEGIEFVIRNRRLMADSRARNVDLVRTEAENLLQSLLQACGEGCAS
jgi:hypothetical protein